MFLDDQLLEMCKNTDCAIPENLQKLNKDLCDACQTYYRGKIYIGMPNKEAKVVLDKTFNFWDSFVCMALKSDDFSLKLLGKLFQEYSFKKHFLQMSN